MQAVIHVHFTERAGKTGTASAQGGGTHIHTLTTIGAGFVATAVQFLLAVGAGVGRRAAAHIATGEALLTCSSIKTRVICTRHGHYFTVLTIETLRTCAGVIVLQIVTAATILAGVAVTFVYLQLTVGASVAGSAGAGVAALAGVGAGGPVSTGLVVGAIVQVLVAEETSPAFFAHTLPRLCAGAMQTARVPHTLAAGRALPAQTTLTLPRRLAVTVTLAAVG